MTVSFFQAANRLHQLLTQTFAGLTQQASGSALDELRNDREFRDLASLRELTEPAHLIGLLIHRDRYETVASRLGLSADQARAIFGGETRASRLLPSFCSLSLQPRLWLGDGLRRDLEKTCVAATDTAMQEWRSSNVRRIAPRGSEPIGFWTAQRSLLIGPNPLIAEYTVQIREDLEAVETFVVQARLKLTDWKGRILRQERVAEMTRNPFLGTQWSREGGIESRFEGVAESGYPWQIWFVPRNLAINVLSPCLHRKQRKDFDAFFRAAGAVCQDVLGFLLTSHGPH